MKNLISARNAGLTVLVIFSIMIVFHLLVMSKIIPSGIVWAGQIGEESSNLIYLELLAISLTLLFGLVVLMKIDLIFQNRVRRFVNIGIWIIFVYFILNTIGNISTGISIESLVFGPVSLVLAILMFRLGIE